MPEWIALISGTVAALLPIANPFSTAPVFASITSHHGEEERNHQAKRAAMYMGGILLGTLLIGALVLSFFSISISAVRVAGGLLIARIGFSMANPSPEENVSEDDKVEARQREDIAFIPIAMPLLSGPGSMAVTLEMASYTDDFASYLSVTTGIVIVALISWVVLHFSTKITGFLGVTGLHALTRIMGFLLLCIGITFISSGLLDALSDPRIIGPIVEAIKTVR